MIVINTIAWLIIAVVMFVFEAITVGLVCIWFCFGALGAFAAAFFTDNIIIQLVVFVAVSALSFLFVKPLAKKAMPDKKLAESTNRFIGKTAKVTESITSDKGRVLLGDVSWLAKTESNEVIEVGMLVKIVGIKGNILIVEKV